MKLQFCLQIFENYTSTKFHDNPSGESRVVPCGETDGRTDRQGVPNSRFRDFANAPK